MLGTSVDINNNELDIFGLRAGRAELNLCGSKKVCENCERPSTPGAPLKPANKSFNFLAPQNNSNVTIVHVESQSSSADRKNSQNFYSSPAPTLQNLKLPQRIPSSLSYEDKNYSLSPSYYSNLSDLNHTHFSNEYDTSTVTSFEFHNENISNFSNETSVDSVLKSSFFTTSGSTAYDLKNWNFDSENTNSFKGLNFTSSVPTACNLKNSSFNNEISTVYKFKDSNFVNNNSLIASDIKDKNFENTISTACDLKNSNFKGLNFASSVPTACNLNNSSFNNEISAVENFKDSNFKNNNALVASGTKDQNTENSISNACDLKNSNFNKENLPISTSDSKKSNETLKKKILKKSQISTSTELKVENSSKNSKKKTNIEKLDHNLNKVTKSTECDLKNKNQSSKKSAISKFTQVLNSVRDLGEESSITSYGTEGSKFLNEFLDAKKVEAGSNLTPVKIQNVEKATDKLVNKGQKRTLNNEKSSKTIGPSTQTSQNSQKIPDENNNRGDGGSCDIESVFLKKISAAVKKTHAKNAAKSILKKDSDKSEKLMLKAAKNEKKNEKTLSKNDKKSEKIEDEDCDDDDDDESSSSSSCDISKSDLQRLKKINNKASEASEKKKSKKNSDNGTTEPSETLSTTLKSKTSKNPSTKSSSKKSSKSSKSTKLKKKKSGGVISSENGAISFRVPGRLTHKTTIKVAHYPCKNNEGGNVVVEKIYCCDGKNQKPEKNDDKSSQSSKKSVKSESTKADCVVEEVVECGPKEDEKCCSKNEADENDCCDDEFENNYDICPNYIGNFENYGGGGYENYAYGGGGGGGAYQNYGDYESPYAGNYYTC